MIIIVIARLFKREIEVIITMICFFIFRPLYEKQYHSKSLFRCSLISIIVFTIISHIEVEKSVSILLAVVIAFTTTLISSYVKIFLEDKVLISKYEVKLKYLDIKSLNNLTEEEMIALMPKIKKDVIHIVYGYLHKGKLNAEIYAINKNISVATLYRYLKLVRETYDKLTTEK